MRSTPCLVLALAVFVTAGASVSLAESPVRSAIIDDPLDFSSEPVLPEIEAPTKADIEASLSRGVQYLLDNQNPNGSWGSPTRTKGLNIYAPVPGAHHAFEAATTSLCLSALLEIDSSDPAVDTAIEKAEAWLLEHLQDLRRATGDAIYNVWGHGYSIQALVRMHARHADDAAMQTEIEELIRLQFEMLQRYESVDG